MFGLEISIKDSNDWDWNFIVNALIAFFSLITSILIGFLTYYIWKEGEKRRVREITARYYELFTGEEFLKIRGFAWNALKRWYTEKDFKDKIFTHIIPVNARDVFFHDNNDEKTKEEYRAVWSMIELLCSLEFSEIDNNILTKYGFYYDWWRVFLMDFCNEYEDRYNTNMKLVAENQSKKMSGLSVKEILEKAKAQFPIPPFIASMRRLNEQLKPTDLARGFEFHPIYRHLSEAPEINAQKVLINLPVPSAITQNASITTSPVNVPIPKTPKPPQGKKAKVIKKPKKHKYRY